MDLLGRILEPGRDLLGRVDATLVAVGAPTDHRIWPLLRHVGALPGDALEFAAGLGPEAVCSAAAALRLTAGEYGRGHAALTASMSRVTWEGEGAESFADRQAALLAHLGDPAVGPDDSVAGRVLATASCLDRVAEWMVALRTGLAGALADALSSAEAVTLRTAGPSGDAVARPTAALPGDGLGGAAQSGGDPFSTAAMAAATVGALVLGSVSAGLRAADELCAEWEPRLVELTFRPAVARGSAPTTTSTTSTGPTTRVAR